MARGELTPQEKANREKISLNLNKLIEEKNVTQVDIHNHTGIPRSTLTGYVKGTSTPNPGNIQKLADYFGVKKSMIDPRFRTKIPNLKQVIETLKIPIIGVITCGDPILAEQNIIDYREEIAENVPTGELFYLQTKGNSMTPTIPENSFVLIRKQETVENNEIAAVLVNGDSEATLKRVKFQGDTMILMPDNLDGHMPIIVNEDNPARIIGKAVKISIDL